MDRRARLTATVDAWLAARAARDPGRLRLAPGFRYTEDGQALPPGAGTWRTLGGHAPGGHLFVDEERGQVEHWGLADEGGRPALVATRLRAAGRTIREAEVIVTRPGAFFAPAAALADALHFHAPVARPAPRDALVAAADAYFDAIERSDSSLVSVRDDCRRLVNGVVDSADDPARTEAGEGHRALPVSCQIDEGHYAYIEALRDRRYPIVDAARGLVVCHLVFDHPGDLPRADGALPFRSPSSMIFTEVFKVVDHRIDEIWALGSGAIPYGSGTGW